MAEPSIFLRYKGDIVGYARYVTVPESGLPSEVIHGHALSSFAKADEHLVAVYGVQIFLEFEERKYRYHFKSFEDIPVVLGDLNRAEKTFKQVIAWDNNKVVDSGPHPVPHLGNVPIKVSVTSIDRIREMLSSSPNKVRFQDSVQFVYLRDGDVSSQEPIENLTLQKQAGRSDIFISSMAKDEGHGELSDGTGDEHADDNDNDKRPLRERFEEESVDQWNDLLSAEDATHLEDKETARKEAAVGLFLKKLDEASPSDDDIVPVSGHKDSTNEERRCRKRAKLGHVRMDQLSPAERISMRIKNRKHRRSRASRKGPVSSDSKARNTCHSTYLSSKSNFVQRNPSSSRGHNENNAVPGQLQREREGSNGEQFRTKDFPQDDLDGSHTSEGIADDCVNDCCSPDGTVIACSTQPVLEVSLGIQKRAYRFKNRKPAKRKLASTLKVRREELVRASYVKNPFITSEHCCNDGCYTNVNAEYTAVQYRKFLLMNRAERKRILKYMYNRKTNKFWFDGSPVCSRFLITLSFSNQLQSAVKGTPKCRASSAVQALFREVRRATKKENIILFLLGLAGILGDALPTKKQYNLPLLSKSQVYGRFLKTASLESGNGYVSLSYFLDIWKRCCTHIKTHRHHGFTVCGTCEKLRSLLAKCESAAAEAMIRAKMDGHYKLMTEERRGYSSRVGLTKKFPGKYLSIIVDGADQKGYGLPHFLFNTKDEQGHKLKVKCVGVLEHGLHKHLSLFPLTEEFETSANHVLEAIHRVVEKKSTGRLPEILFIQADNCTRENKNRYFMSYCEMLVALGVFAQVQVISFLLVIRMRILTKPFLPLLPE